MKKTLTLFIAYYCCLLQIHAQPGKTDAPKLVKTGNHTRLFVDGKPFLVLGGELGNSSASSNEYMRPIWPKLKAMNLNTVIAPVYWELSEPVEGQFDFSLVDSLLIKARANNMKLVLLWFGVWKNSMSCYAPEWVKTNTARFPRVKDKNGVQQEILTPFNRNNLEADKKAFARFMQYIKEKNSGHNTVIAIQVENEIGMLPDARTYDEAANTAFGKAIPQQLLSYLQKNKNLLTPELKLAWETNGYKMSGTWEEVFGKGLVADEIFTAWFYAVFTNELTIEGKKVYGLPMFVNAALNRPNWKPGQYPSGGPLPHIMDIWKAGAPVIDIFSPDIYFPDFKHWCDLYTRFSHPLFIPEIRFEKGVDAKAIFAYGNYNCLAFSPFSIESTDHPEKEPIGKAYHIINQVSHLITKYQPAGNVKGFLLEKDSTKEVVIGNYRLTINHEYKLGWSAGAKEQDWPLAACMIIQTGPDELYVTGTGIVATFASTLDGKRAGFISIDEGKFENEKWIPGRRLNGDQDHQGRHVRIPYSEYSIQHVKLYSY